MRPINKNYQISQGGPHVGLGTGCTGAQPNKESRLTLSPIQTNRQLRIPRQEQHLKYQSIEHDSMHDENQLTSSSWRGLEVSQSAESP